MQLNKVPLKFLIIAVLSVIINFRALAGNPVSEILLDNDTIRISSTLVNFPDTVNGFDGDYYQLKFENKIASTIYVTWDLELKYEDMCINCAETKKPEYYRAITLKPNQIFESNCKKVEDRKYVMLKKFNNMDSKVLVNFFLRNLKTSKI